MPTPPMKWLFPGHGDTVLLCCGGHEKTTSAEEWGGRETSKSNCCLFVWARPSLHGLTQDPCVSRAKLRRGCWPHLAWTLAKDCLFHSFGPHETWSVCCRTLQRVHVSARACKGVESDDSCGHAWVFVRERKCGMFVFKVCEGYQPTDIIHNHPSE